jgi:hypothetical protein
MKNPPSESSLEAGFQAFPALERLIAIEEMASIAWEEHAREVGREMELIYPSTVASLERQPDSIKSMES